MPDYDDATMARLLELQTEDTAIRGLQRRKAELPEAQRLNILRDDLAELESDLEIARKQATELTHEQTRIEGEVGLLDQKIAREEGRLFSGGVSNPRELSALQSEVAMLKTRRGEMEDGLLEVMVQKESAEATRERLEREHDDIARDAGELEAAVRSLTGDIDEQLGAHSERRDSLAGDTPGPLLALYDQLREQKGGVGAAALRGDTCEGCHTKLPSREVERARSEGGLQRCDNCRRILVIV